MEGINTSSSLCKKNSKEAEIAGLGALGEDICGSTSTNASTDAEPKELSMVGNVMAHIGRKYYCYYSHYSL